MQIDAPESPDLRGEVEDLLQLPAGGTHRNTRRRNILGVVASFFVGQGAVQAVNTIVALFLVHKLTIEAYAQFGLAFGFQTTASNLMDLGFASTIIPLVGEGFEDRALVGRYVRAACRLRNRAFLILAPVTVIAFFAIGHKHSWSWGLQVALISAVLLTLYSSGNVACYSAPFILYRRLKEYYAPQTLSGLARLLGYGVLQISGALNAWTAAALSALNVTAISRVLAKESGRLVEWPDGETRAAEREIVRYVLPAMPAIIFAAFQSQISLFLVSIFGGTVSIAQVAALSRITQLFMVLQTFNMVIVEPYIARLSHERLLRTYLGLIALASACCVPVVVFSFTYPGLVLWVLGSKYEGLQSVVGWLVLSSCMNYVAGLAYIMNRARKWVFWSGTILEIILLLGVQIVYIAVVGVRSTRQAVLLSVASSVCYIVAHGYTGIYGFFKGPRFETASARSD